MNATPLYRQSLKVNDRVRVSGRWELGVGEVCRIREDEGFHIAEVIFEDRQGRRVETLPANRLEPVLSPWDKLAQGNFDNPKDFLSASSPGNLPLAILAESSQIPAHNSCRIRFCSLMMW